MSVCLPQANSVAGKNHRITPMSAPGRYSAALPAVHADSRVDPYVRVSTLEATEIRKYWG